METSFRISVSVANETINVSIDSIVNLSVNLSKLDDVLRAIPIVARSIGVHKSRVNMFSEHIEHLISSGVIARSYLDMLRKSEMKLDLTFDATKGIQVESMSCMLIPSELIQFIFRLLDKDNSSLFSPLKKDKEPSSTGSPRPSQEYNPLCYEEKQAVLINRIKDILDYNPSDFDYENDTTLFECDRFKLIHKSPNHIYFTKGNGFYSLSSASLVFLEDIYKAVTAPDVSLTTNF